MAIGLNESILKFALKYQLKVLPFEEVGIQIPCMYIEDPLILGFEMP